MSAASTPESIVREFWRLMATNDFQAVTAVLADDLVVEWPQSRERMRGAQTFARMNTEYPTEGHWTFQLERVVAGGDEVVTWVRVTDGTQSATPISFFTVAGDRIVRMVEFWPEPFAPAANRTHLVELMP